MKVSAGLLAQEARRINEHFFTFYEQRRPFISLKFAASLDSKIATRTGDAKWITSREARVFARRLRGEHHAVLVGAATVLRDNPHLGARTRGLRDPLRIILDSQLRVPLRATVFRDLRALVATTDRADSHKGHALEARGISVVPLGAERVLLAALIRELVQRKNISVLVEGGGETFGSFVDTGLVDKVYAFHAPLVIGGEYAVSAVRGRGARTIQKTLRIRDVERMEFWGHDAHGRVGEAIYFLQEKIDRRK